MLKPGDLLGDDFEILQLLSRGGMGAVYLARQRSTLALRAVKVMLPRWAVDADFRARFAREATASARIASEHVVNIVAHGVEGQRALPWIAMEYLQGQDLQARVAERGPPTGADLYELLRQLFSAVAAAHAAGLVHRDLKPTNLFVADAQQAEARFSLKLLDFGIAKILGEGESGTQALGTRAWMAPEQAETGAHIQPSADVWALGLLVFWLCTGKSYWRHAEEGGPSLSYEVHFADLPSASERACEFGEAPFGEPLDRWFARCVVRASGARFADAQQCWEALRPLLSTLPVSSNAGCEWALPSTGPRDRSASPTADVISEVALASPAPAPPAITAARAPWRATRLYNVPQASQSFVGRSRELGRLRTELLGAGRRACVAVEGLPGMGKTELLLQFAERAAADGLFAGGIFWLPAEQPDLAAAWASDAIAGALGASGSSLQSRAQQAVNALSSCGAPLLIILDNVEDWTEAQRPAPLPEGLHVALLVSTRKHRLGGSRFRSMPLSALSLAEARELFSAAAGFKPSSRPGAEALLLYLDGHTLAVELAAATLGQFPELLPLQYLERLQDNRDPDGSAIELTRYERTLRQAFEVLWQRLSPRVQGLWQLAAQFEPEPVSAALSDAVGLDAAARAELGRYCLIESDRGGSWRMHRLTRAYAWAAAGAAVANAAVGDALGREAAERALIAGAAACVKHVMLGSGFEVYLRDRAHLDRATALACAREYSVLGGELLASIATARHSLGEFAAARSLFERALAGDRAHFGDDHENVATLRSNLSLVMEDLGETEQAFELLEAALRSDLAARADNHVKILLRRSNLGRYLGRAGQPQRARQVLTSALEEGVERLGDDHWMVAIARSNLAGILIELDELGPARELIVSALDSDLARYGEEHQYVAIRRYRLACLLEREGDLAGAIELLRVAAESQLRSLGPDHPTYGLSLAKLATLLLQSGESALARQRGLSALRIAQGQPARSQARVQIEALIEQLPFEAAALAGAVRTS